MSTFLYIVLGYCAFMWVLVIILFCFTNVLRGAHPLIVPHAPLVPFVLLRDLYEAWKERISENRVKEAARWIVQKLREAGITVRGEFGIRDDGYEAIGCYLGQCQIIAEVREGQEQAYGEVYARAIQKFSHLTPRVICSEAIPAEFLGRDWAESHGLSEYFAVELYVPCEDCGIAEKFHSLQWGDDVSHRQRWTQEQTFYFGDCTKQFRHVSGHLCQRCSKALGWSGSAGGALQKVDFTQV